MTGEKLLQAMQAVDPALAADAHAPRRRARPMRRLTAALIAAALLLALAGTATAAYHEDWFTGFFAEMAGGELTESQQAAVKAMTAVVGQSKTVQGWTITVEQAIAGKDAAYIQLSVTAPEGTAVDPKKQGLTYGDMTLSGFNDRSTSTAGVMSTSVQMDLKREEGAAENEAVMLISLDRTATAACKLSLADGKSRTLTIKDLSRLEKDEKGKTVEKPLVKGTWRFTFALPPAAEVELLAQPMSVMARSPEGKAREDVVITSFRLDPLGASCEYEAAGDYIREFDDIQVVMAGGETVTGRAAGNGARDFGKVASFVFEVPIDLEQVRYVQFQGEKLSLPG